MAEDHPGCCEACKGTGAGKDGPCWDCRGTGHPHPLRLCWCGGQMGLREPGDEDGLGCLLDITHLPENQIAPTPQDPT